MFSYCRVFLTETVIYNFDMMSVEVVQLLYTVL